MVVLKKGVENTGDGTSDQMFLGKKFDPGGRLRVGTGGESISRTPPRAECDPKNRFTSTEKKGATKSVKSRVGIRPKTVPGLKNRERRRMEFERNWSRILDLSEGSEVEADRVNRRSLD